MAGIERGRSAPGSAENTRGCAAAVDEDGGSQEGEEREKEKKQAERSETAEGVNVRLKPRADLGIKFQINKKKQKKCPC